jgi:hypothetical protein
VVGEFGTDTSPEFRSLAGLDPDAQDVLEAFHVHAHGDVRGTVPPEAAGTTYDSSGTAMDTLLTYAVGRV